MVQGYKLTHITFKPEQQTIVEYCIEWYRVQIEIHPSQQLQVQQKPYIAATSMAEQQVLPFKIRACLPIGK